MERQILKKFGIEGESLVIKRGSLAKLMQEAPFFVPYSYRHYWSGDTIYEDATISVLYKDGHIKELKQLSEWTTGDGKQGTDTNGDNLKDFLNEDVVAVLFQRWGNDQGKEWEICPEIWLIDNQTLDIRKIRRRIEDCLRKTDTLTILTVAIALNVKLD